MNDKPDNTEIGTESGGGVFAGLFNRLPDFLKDLLSGLNGKGNEKPAGQGRPMEGGTPDKADDVLPREPGEPERDLPQVAGLADENYTIGRGENGEITFVRRQSESQVETLPYVFEYELGTDKDGNPTFVSKESKPQVETLPYVAEYELGRDKNGKPAIMPAGRGDDGNELLPEIYEIRVDEKGEPIVSKQEKEGAFELLPETKQFELKPDEKGDLVLTSKDREEGTAFKALMAKEKEGLSGVDKMTLSKSQPEESRGGEPDKLQSTPDGRDTEAEGLKR